MKHIQLILFVLFLCVISFAQDSKTKFTLFDDGCGDPMVESQLYENREGTITKVTSANKVIFSQSRRNGNKEKGKFTVELVGIDSSKNQTEITKFLKKYILNKKVEITGNLRNKSDAKFKGLVFVPSDHEEIDWISENLLELGIAKYKEFSSDNLVPYNSPCQLEKAEQRAKTAKIGIWTK